MRLPRRGARARRRTCSHELARRLARVQLADLALGDRAPVRVHADGRPGRVQRARAGRRRRGARRRRRRGASILTAQAAGLVVGGLLGSALPAAADAARRRRSRSSRCRCRSSRSRFPLERAGDRRGRVRGRDRDRDLRRASGTRRCSRRSRPTSSRASTRTTRSARSSSSRSGYALAGPVAEAFGVRRDALGRGRDRARASRSPCCSSGTCARSSGALRPARDQPAAAAEAPPA